MELKQVIGDKTLKLGDSYWYIDERLIKVYKIWIVSFQDIDKGLFRFADQIECFEFIKSLQEQYNIKFFNYKDEHDTKLTFNKLMHRLLTIHSITYNGLVLEVGKTYSLKRTDITIDSFIFNAERNIFAAVSKEHKTSFDVDQITEF